MSRRSVKMGRQQEKRVVRAPFGNGIGRKLKRDLGTMKGGFAPLSEKAQ